MDLDIYSTSSNCKMETVKFQLIPTFEGTNWLGFRHELCAILPRRISDLVTRLPDRPVVERDEEGKVIRKTLSKQKNFDEDNLDLYRALTIATRGYEHLRPTLEQVALHDGVGMIKFLNQKFLTGSSFNKWMATHEFFKLAQSQEDVSLYYQRTRQVFSKLVSMHVKMEDLLVMQFLMGASSRYDKLRENFIMSGQERSIDELMESMLAVDSRATIRSIDGTAESSEARRSAGARSTKSATETEPERAAHNAAYLHTDMSKKQTRNSRPKCFLCDSTEHTLNHCPHKKRFQSEQLNVSQKRAKVNRAIEVEDLGGSWSC